MTSRFVKRKFFALLVFIICVLVFLFEICFVPKKETNFSLNLFIESSLNNQEDCRQPQLELWNELILKHIKNVSKITCKTEDPDWLLLRNGYVEINQQVIDKYDNGIDCRVTYMKRKDDYQSIKGAVVKLNSNTNKRVKLVDDFFWAKCITVVKEKIKTWENVMAGVHQEESVMKRAKLSNKIDNKDKLNVLMFGFDSTSRMHFMRKLPNTYKHLINKLNAIVLKGYNIVGDGTPQALVPILTGKTEFELPETRKRMSNAYFVNVYPFIWYNFSDYGYVTGYTEDGQWVGTFSYRMKGFDKKPTDHFMRPFYMEAQDLFKYHPDYCLQATPRHQIMLNYVKDIFTVYPKEIPKFVFGFHSEFSHDDFNLIQAIDDDFVDWLKSLETQEILNSTILIVMADHGSRFSSIRGTQQGKQEERLPFFSIVLPKWFKSTFPRAFQNLVANQNRLTTPFDIHATFLTIIDNFNKKKDVLDISYLQKLPRSLSLFNQIPKRRSCSHAEIEPHWCTCLKWTSIDTSDKSALKAANALVEYLNYLTKDFRTKCSELKLKNFTRVEILIPNKDLLAFKKSADFDGFKPDLSDKIKISEITYQIQLKTSPNDGIYEATILHLLDKNTYSIKESDISRINMYGDQPKCIFNEQQHLRKYCYCIV